MIERFQIEIEIKIKINKLYKEINKLNNYICNLYLSN